jgi:hypothetical protein
MEEAMVLMAMKRVVLIISVSDTVLYVDGTCSDFCVGERRGDSCANKNLQ